MQDPCSRTHTWVNNVHKLFGIEFNIHQTSSSANLLWPMLFMVCCCGQVLFVYLSFGLEIWYPLSIVTVLTEDN